MICGSDLPTLGPIPAMPSTGQVQPRQHGNQLAAAPTVSVLPLHLVSEFHP